MINIKDLKVQGNETSNENDLSLINNNLLSDTKINLKTRNEAINSLSDNNIKKFFQSNYSFSDKTIGNEFSKINFESIEEELITKNERSLINLNKKENPIYLSHSDYFYCPDSKTEKNLNDQIMKYLKENNLEIKKKSKKPKNILKNVDINNIFEMIKNKNNFINESNNLDNNINNNIIRLKDNKRKNIKIDSENDSISYCLQQYIEQMKKYQNYNKPINQINNIKIKNIYITNNEKNINTFSKSKNLKKEKNYDMKIEKINKSKDKINISKNGFNNKLYNTNKNSKHSYLNNKINNNKISFPNKNNNENKNKSENQLVNKKKLISNMKNNDNKYIKNNNSQNNKYEIDSNIVNEKIICENKNNNKKDLSSLSTISLQSINDSKLLLIADDLIKKDVEFK